MHAEEECHTFSEEEGATSKFVFLVARAGKKVATVDVRCHTEFMSKFLQLK